MRISVIILNWNRADDTIAAVTSTLRQDHADFEVLVWDNSSSDDSRARLEATFGRDERVRLLWGDANYGVAGGRNRAFRAARGEIVLSLDSDATLETPGALRHTAGRFDAEPDLGAISYEVVRPDGHLMWPFARSSVTWRTRRFDTIRVDGCSFATRRALFDRVGGFPEHYSPYGAEDQYYAYQVIGAGYRVSYDPAVRVIHSFTPKARQGRQFAMHVRNMIWMPLEVFPWPEGPARALRQALYLRNEAKEQQAESTFREGLREALAGFRCSRSRTIPRHSASRIRALIAEDKAARD
ncbi:MAG TPA: glycosyltransferase family 2 protein [Kiritimatiellia bacterium]|nr:glycosyltransferase family 2 protein [Kiritimatiellia bacterium]